MKQHEKDGGIKCDICDKDFKFKAYLKRHRDKCLLRFEKGIQCQICNKTLSSKGTLFFEDLWEYSKSHFLFINYTKSQIYEKGGETL